MDRGESTVIKHREESGTGRPAGNPGGRWRWRWARRGKAGGAGGSPIPCSHPVGPRFPMAWCPHLATTVDCGQAWLVVLGERWARGRAGEPMAGSRGRGLEEKWDALELTEDSGENLPSVPPPRDPAMTRIAPLEAPTTIANWPVSLCLQPARLGWDVPDSGDGQAGFAEPFPGSSVVESGPPLPLFIIPKLDSARLQLHVPPPP